jgi:EpsI family protein
MNMARFMSVFALLASTAGLLHIRGYTEIRAYSEPLSMFPEELAGWESSTRQIDAASLAVLGPGDFLSRSYSRPGNAPIDLFIAYFPSQRTGATIHSPKNCLPGAGWTFESSSTAYLRDSTGKLHQVGEYVVSNSDTKAFVIYWYQAHGRSVASEYAAKMYLVTDAIRMNRSDGALIRVITRVSPLDGPPNARIRAEEFTSELFPLLSRFIPD